jgi:hypothetical protein
MVFRLLLPVLISAKLVIAYQDVARPPLSPAAADALGLKIAAILAAESDVSRPPGATTITVSEIEMESFVVYWMQEDIPPRVEAIDVTVTTGAIRADTRLLFGDDLATGNPLVDRILLGTHRLSLGGRLAATEGRGTFMLQEVRVDGIPIPLAVVDILVERYVKPDYPAVDLDSPFDLPWGIERVELVDGRARIAY